MAARGEGTPESGRESEALTTTLIIMILSMMVRLLSIRRMLDKIVVSFNPTQFQALALGGHHR